MFFHLLDRACWSCVWDVLEQLRCQYLWILKYTSCWSRVKTALQTQNPGLQSLQWVYRGRSSVFSQWCRCGNTRAQREEQLIHCRIVQGLGPALETSSLSPQLFLLFMEVVSLYPAILKRIFFLISTQAPVFSSYPYPCNERVRG